MGVSLTLLPAISLFLLISLYKSTALIPQIDAQTSCENQQPHLICELQEAKLRIARLESIHEESIHDLNAKSLYLRECEKLIEEVTQEIGRLQSALSSFKGGSTRAYQRLNVLEEEVQLLWAASRKNNFDLHTLESKAQDAEKRLEVVTLQAEKIAEIVTEQWIQIQQLEQALQIAEILDPYLFDKGSALNSYLSQSWHQVKRTLSAAEHSHHQLQGYIKQEMEKNEFTAAFANREVVFFVASALITFPIMSAGMFLLSQFS